MQAVYNRLPITYMYNGELCEYFQTRELSLSDLERMQDIKMKRSNPVTWVAKACCMIIENIGGVNVYEQYVNTKTIPDIIKKMPMGATTSVLIAGHIETLDSQIVDYPMRCPNSFCGEVNNVDLDLLSLDIPMAESSYEKSVVEVELGKGFKLLSDISKHYNLDPNIPFTKLSIRQPILGDVMALENLFTRDMSEVSPFWLKLYGKCIIKMETADGDMLPDDVLDRQRGIIVGSLGPKDILIIKRALNKAFPKLEISAIKVCEKCGEEIKYDIDASFLFSMT